METRALSRAASFAVVMVAYLLAACAAWATVSFCARAFPAMSLLWKLFDADVMATLVIFAGSVLFNNSSMYDAYWSAAPPLIAGYLFVQSAPACSRARQAVVLSLVAFWAVRLTYNWARGWSGLGQEDWRYVDIRIKTGALYWPASAFALHLMPTAMVFLGCYPLFPALATGTRPLGLLDLIAALVGCTAVILELVADEQLHTFRQRPENAGKPIDQGLWRTSRHPNYLGEMGFWWGLSMFGFAASDHPACFVGAIAISALFVFASIPMAEKRAQERRPGYAARLKQTRLLLPWPPK